MRLTSLVARGYRNLVDLEREAPARGVAILGRNAQGKTNLLEAIYYPVLFRSFRGAPDQQIVGGALGFHVEVRLEGSEAESVATTYGSRKKRITVDGEETGRLADAVGTWLGVAFLPSDLGLELFLGVDPIPRGPGPAEQCPATRPGRLGARVRSTTQPVRCRVGAHATGMAEDGLGAVRG